MKDEWLREQQRLKRAALELRHDLPRPVSPRRVWRIDGVVGRYEWAVPLLSGDIIAVVCVMGNQPRFPMAYRTQPPLRPLRCLQAAEYEQPHTISFFCELFNDVFLTLDYDNELRVHCARTNTVQWQHTVGDIPITDVEVVRTNAEEALVVITDEDGNIRLFRHLRGQTRCTILVDAHSEKIVEVAAAGARFAVCSMDGLLTIWDVLRREQIARIFNTRPVKIKMDAHHLVSYIDYVIRVYDAKCGYKLKHSIPLPKGPDPVLYPMLNLLSESLAVYHDEAGCILFFELATGNVVFRLRSPFRSVNCFKILKDLSIILSSEDETEGHAVVSLPYHHVVHEALSAHVRCKYGEVMPAYKERKWAHGIMFTICTGALWRLVRSVLAARRHASSSG